jgi:hypothetical protein
MKLEQIRELCVEDGDCLIWKGYTSGVTPMVRHQGKKTGVRRLLLEESAVTVRPGFFVGSTCLNANCVAPEHAVQRTKSQQGKAAAANSNSAAQKAKVAIAARKRARLTMQVAEAIRAEDGTLREAAAKHGVSLEWVRRIRNGEVWRNSANPFGGLMA